MVYISSEIIDIFPGVSNTLFVRQNGESVPEEVVNAFLMAKANIAESGEKDFYTYPYSVGQYYTEKWVCIVHCHVWELPSGKRKNLDGKIAQISKNYQKSQA